MLERHVTVEGVQLVNHGKGIPEVRAVSLSSVMTSGREVAEHSE